MEQEQARALLITARVGHLATADGEGRPHLVPVVFAARGDVVVTAVDQKPKRTTALRRLRNIEANGQVSLLVDHYDEDWSTLWWVRADGRARILDDATEPLRWLIEKYDQYRAQPPTGPVIRVDVTTWRGWTATEGDATDHP